METFYKNGKAVIGFLIITLLFSMFAGQQMTQRMVLLVLLGAILLNSDTIISFLKDDNDTKKSNKKE